MAPTCDSHPASPIPLFRCESHYITSAKSLQDSLGGMLSWRRCIWTPGTGQAALATNTGECGAGDLFVCAPPAPPQPSGPPPPPPFYPPPSPPPRVSVSAPACRPANDHDVSTHSCLSWCTPRASKAQCPYCACSACDFCRRPAGTPPPAPLLRSCADILKSAGLANARHKNDPQWCFHFHVRSVTRTPTPACEANHALTRWCAARFGARRVIQQRVLSTT